jgi:putative methyltransferase (TIGR04325 family)
MTADWKSRLAGLPVIKPLLERLYERHFAVAGYGGFRGVFKTFEEAHRSSPATKPLGFDNAGYAREFEGRLSQVYPFDYPVLFWLRNLLAPGTTLFDFGGHRGTHFYAYQQYLVYPEGFQWIVCDVPVILEAGKALARDRGATQLTFTTDFRQADHSDIFLAAGSLQYVESPRLHEMLTALSARPNHLLLNKLPLYSGKEYVTLQNGGPAFHAQYVFNREEFLQPLRELGYELVDAWEVPTHAGRIPFHPQSSFQYHSGLYLRQAPLR